MNNIPSLSLVVETKRNERTAAKARHLYVGRNALIELEACAKREKRPYFSADKSRFMGLEIYLVEASPDHCEVL